MPIGSIRSPGGVVRSTTRGRPFLSFDRYWYGEKPPLAAFVAGSDVQEAHVLCVALDERPPGLDVLAHQDAEQLVGERRIVESLSLIHISEPTRLLSISYAVFCLK